MFAVILGLAAVLGCPVILIFWYSRYAQTPKSEKGRGIRFLEFLGTFFAVITIGLFILEITGLGSLVGISGPLVIAAILGLAGLVGIVIVGLVGYVIKKRKS
jgi:hypothetical protein